MSTKFFKVQNGLLAGNLSIDASTGTLTTSGNITTTANVIVGTTILNNSGTFSTANAIITGGTVDGTPIGATTAAAGHFTTLAASGGITGTLSTAAQPNITSVGTLSSLTVSGTITGSITGSAATVTAPSQPSITSVGTLTGLTVSSTISGSVSGNAGTATKLATARNISASGDATWTVSFDGSADDSAALTLATVNSNVGSFGSNVLIPVVTVNGKGLVTAVSTTAVAFPSTSVTLVGDATGSGSTGSNITVTLASVATAGTTGDSTHTSQLTFNAKGLVTSSTNVAIAAATVTGDVTGSVQAGQSGALTLATVNVSPVTASFQKLTVNGKGLVTATTSVTSSDITTALGYTPLNLTGGTMSGNIAMSSNYITGLADPVNPQDAATKNYVDTAVAGLSWKDAVVAATTTNITLSGTQTIDGVAVTAGQRVLVKNQSTNSQNGIYVVASGAWTRATDSSTATEITGEAVNVTGGTTYANTQWVENAIVTTVGTSAVTYAEFGGAGTYSAGTGLTLSTNQFSITNVGTAGTYTAVTTNAQGQVVAGTNLAVTGDVSGTASGNSVALTLATVNSSVGTWNNVTVNGKGLVTAGSNVAYLTSNQNITVSGDVSGSGTTAITATLATVNSNTGTWADSTHVPQFVVNGKGLVTAVSNVAIASATLNGDASATVTPGATTALTLATVNSNTGTFTAVTLNGKGLATAATNLAATGDATGTASGSGIALTLATVNSNTGTWADATHVPQFVVNGKGLVTAVSNVAIASTTISTSTGLSGGGTVAPGGTLTLTNTGVTSISGGTDITANVSTGAVLISDTSTLSSVTGRGATTSTAVTLSGGVTVPSITHTGTNGVGDIGASGATFGTVYATTFSGISTQAKYADLAEKYVGDKLYAPGTVVEFGGTHEVTLASALSRKIAGVVSTAPAYLMNSGLTGPTVVAVAFTGRVPCMVKGPVKKGDMMVSGGSGYAISSKDPASGSCIGKALADFNGSGFGVIEVVVGK